MTDAAHHAKANEAEVPEMHRTDEADDTTIPVQSNRTLSPAALSSPSLLTRCFRRFDLVVLANHLYLLISLGYLSLDSLRLVMSAPGHGQQSASAMMGPELGAEAAESAASTSLAQESSAAAAAAAAALSHLHFVLLSDTCMLLLAALFVADACMFAFVHARDTYAARSEQREMNRKQQQQQQHAVHSPTITSLRIESASSTSASSSHSERQSLLLASLPSKLAGSSSSPTSSSAHAHSSSVHVELTPFIAARRNSAAPASVVSPPPPPAVLGSSSADHYSCLPLLSLFLSSPAGIAELLNILGGLGYLLSSLIPFLFFLVSESVERSLDRAANVVDNLAMGVFVMDSWLYLALWSSRDNSSGGGTGRRRTAAAAAAAGTDESGDSHEDELDHSLSGGQNQERQGLIAPSDAASSPTMASLASGSPSPSPPAGQRRRSSRPLLSPSSSSSSSSSSSALSSSHRSLCVRRTWDLALLSNVLNILAGFCYLASTIFGFVIRVQADAELHRMIKEDAESSEAAAAAADTAAGATAAAVVAAGAAASSLLHSSHSSWQQASLFLFFQSASRSSRRDPLLDSSIVSPELRHSATYGAWSRSVERGFHDQQWLALGGDLMYFLCALAMEAAYYASQNQSRQRGKEEEEQEQEEDGMEMEETGASEPATDAEDDDGPADARQSLRHGSGGVGEGMRIHLDAPSDSDDARRGNGSTVAASSGAVAAAAHFSPLQLQLLTPQSAVSSHSHPGSTVSPLPNLFVPSASPPASATSSATPTPTPTVAAASGAPFLRHPPQTQQSYSPHAPNVNQPAQPMPFPINAVLAEAQQQQQRQPRTTMFHASNPASTATADAAAAGSGSSIHHVIAVDARDASFSMTPISPPTAATPHSHAESRSNSRA